MFNILIKFLKKKNNNIIFEFSEIKKKNNIKKIFNAIDDYSSTSEIRYVGGCVRKVLNNENIDDIDLAVNIDPAKVKEALEKKGIKYYETGIDHGTITAVIENDKYEITSLRSDISTDGRHAKVKFTNDWLKDAQRRDFTINSIYSDKSGNLFDPFDGKKDLKNGKVIFIGDIENRIKEDYLRILRYLRFFSIYSNDDHELKVKKILKKNIKGIKKISHERLLDEFKKILKSNILVKLCDDEFSLEMIKFIFPQFINIDSVKKFNQFNKNRINEMDFCFILSLLIIDGTDNLDYFNYKFNISKQYQKRMKFIKNFFFNKNKENKFNTTNLWKIFYKFGKDSLFDVLNYQLFTSKNIDKKIIKHLNFFKDKSIPIFPIKGHTLIKKFGIPEGEKIGENLKLIENFWLDNNFKISEKDLKRIVKH